MNSRPSQRAPAGALLTPPEPARLRHVRGWRGSSISVPLPSSGPCESNNLGETVRWPPGEGGREPVRKPCRSVRPSFPAAPGTESADCSTFPAKRTLERHGTRDASVALPRFADAARAPNEPTGKAGRTRHDKPSAPTPPEASSGLPPRGRKLQAGAEPTEAPPRGEAPAIREPGIGPPRRSPPKRNSSAGRSPKRTPRRGRPGPARTHVPTTDW